FGQDPLLVGPAGYGIPGEVFHGRPAQWPRGMGPMGAGPSARDAVGAVVRWGGPNFAGKRGTGRYAGPQRHAYRTIAQHVGAHRPVCVRTRPTVAKAKKEDPQRGESGETKAKGLAGHHSYAVLGCHEDARTELRFVRVLNPWGHYGRGYAFTN